MPSTPATSSSVSAPTGSGKTLVAAYAVHRALCARGKAFYTTPLKALSNQKYGELVAAYGEDHVGLLTGDTTLRPRAPVVVMTTEVLRNMLLAGSDLLEGPPHGRARRGPLHPGPLPGRGVGGGPRPLARGDPLRVPLGHREQRRRAGGWLRSVRGDTAVIVERHRPIVLRHHFAVVPPGGRRDAPAPAAAATTADPGEEGLRIDQAVRRALQGRSAHWQARGRGPRLPFRAPATAPRWSTSSGRREMLPAIVFIFSRAACDDAVRQVVRDGVRLTDAQERSAIRADRRAPGRAPRWTRISRCSATTSGSRASNGAWRPTMPAWCRSSARRWRSASPPGSLKVVFATETLSLGINMPARSVVIERFTKYGGAGRATLTSGEYLQLTGRAGAARPRRGRARRRGLVERDHLRRGGPGGIGAAPGPALGLPADVQPGRQPRGALRPGHGGRRAAPLLRPMAGAQAGSPVAAAAATGSPCSSRWATSTAGR